MKIRLFITDIDGTMTDGGYFSPSVPELTCQGMKIADFPPQLYLRKFNTCDFVGIKMLSDAGIHCVALTGSNEPGMPQFNRAGRDMEVCPNVQDKFEYVKTNFIDGEYHKSYHWDEVAFIGDEINDCALLAAVGLAACPADAAREVKAIVEDRGDGFVLSHRGGELCVREFTDMIRDMQGIKASWCNWEEK